LKERSEDKRIREKTQVKEREEESYESKWK
jgi:hypothetical protein